MAIRRPNRILHLFHIIWVGLKRIPVVFSEFGDFSSREIPFALEARVLSHQGTQTCSHPLADVTNTLLFDDFAVLTIRLRIHDCSVEF